MTTITESGQKIIITKDETIWVSIPLETGHKQYDFIDWEDIKMTHEITGILLKRRKEIENVH